MGGGLLQLVAHGAQDIYLTGDPQITYFKVVYRRHTNFSMESIQQQFSSTASSGNKTTCIISRNGDLIASMYLQFKLSAGALLDQGFVSYLNSVEIEIGGQKIDKHYGRWLDIWSDLTNDANKDDALTTMLGNNTAGGTGPVVNNSISSDDPAYALVPLSFWFNKNYGLALPLIALQYHEVKLNFDFATNSNWSAVTLWVDYVFLDSDERKRFAQMSHEYLIDQVQFGGTEDFSSSTAIGTTDRFALHFNHPVKELIWVGENSSAIAQDTFKVDGSGTNNNPAVAAGTRQIDVNNVKLQLNGHDRFYPRSSEYFRLQQPYQFHSTVPPSQDIYIYSFALRPEEHQPSGTCNFSRIDSCHLTLTRGGRMPTGSLGNRSFSDKLYIYAINYNVLRIASGMAGLAYSN
tara:strand:- start:15401 stop:16615 length:1215 start_codon:yes stop_codon:yes gene_type:complete